MADPVKKSDAKWCHRFMVPMPLVEQTVNPLNKQVMVKPKAEMSFIQCLGDQCSIWVSSQKKCGDLVRAESLAEIARCTKSDHDLKIVDGAAG